MTRISLLIALFYLFGISPTYSQEEKPSAKAIVNVSDFENKPREAEIILFIDKESGKVLEGLTKANGSFEIQLQGARTYQIKIKGFSKDEEYSEIEIPEIKEGQKVTFTIDIQFEPGKSFSLDHVHFESGKASLTKDSYSELNELVDYLKLKKQIKIEIAGHTDDIGEEKSNLNLSQKRADRVRNYLISKGIEATRIVAKGYGESRPIADNSTEEGRQKNRRTEVHILD